MNYYIKIFYLYPVLVIERNLNFVKTELRIRVYLLTYKIKCFRKKDLNTLFKKSIYNIK